MTVRPKQQKAWRRPRTSKFQDTETVLKEVITVSSDTTPTPGQSVLLDSGFVIAADLVSVTSASYSNSMSDIASGLSTSYIYR